MEWLKTLTCKKAEILSHMLSARLYLFECDFKSLFLLKIQDLAVSFNPGVVWYVFFSKISIVWNVFVLLIYQARLVTPHLLFFYCVCTCPIAILCTNLSPYDKGKWNSFFRILKVRQRKVVWHYNFPLSYLFCFCNVSSPSKLDL